MTPSPRLTLVSMSGLRVGHEPLLERGMSLPGLAKRASALSQLPPLGLLTIAAAVEPHWSIEMVTDDGRCAPSETLEAIRATEPDVVAFSALTPAADRAAAISRMLREYGIITMIGGLHATAAPEHCRDAFDVVVRGEGEAVFPQALADYNSGRLEREYVAKGTFDLAQSPLPRWDLIKSPPPRYTLQTMRGCPWACSFCAASRLLGPPRTKPNLTIARELEAITQRQSRPWLELADDNTFASDRDPGPMLDLLEEHRARWFTESDWRIALRPQWLTRIAKSGCRQILVGLESNVFRYPGMGAKTAELDRMVEAIEVIQDAGIVVNACFIVGGEGETVDSINRLAAFLDTAPFGEVQLTLQTPFPGTSLYQSLRRSGRLLDPTFERYTLFDVVYQPDRMSPNELQQQFMRLIEFVFRSEAQARRDKIRKSILHRRRHT